MAVQVPAAAVEGQVGLEHDQSIALFNKGSTGGAKGNMKRSGLDTVLNEAQDDQTKKLFIIVSTLLGSPRYHGSLTNRSSILQ